MSTPQKACPLCYLYAKNFRNRWKFDKVLTKNKFAQFFLRHGVEEKLLWRKAYRNSPTLFRTAPSPTPYGPHFPEIGIRNS